ncbi:MULTISPECIES: sulfurtransferase [unclassified Duganella]|uniref:sulfurtransferase n=1 Tax=unclassified Duganella TaxID=2636909 RepID=UPI0006FCDBE6|nr:MULTISPECIES: sulfurtransferase [unclassified Duganella]KQV51052.1 3-mercaptopyruvate sulfurtransferase [Duganella sp. Root336D2]KRC00633.1 3-mercaptopyruvate sulfurtransferase [Duganella sp. Root198D2]
MFTTLIDANTLSQHLSDPQWVILDCRHDLMNPDFGRNAFAEGHIENAQFANIDTDLSGPKTGSDGVFRGRHPLPDRAALLETLRRWGINDDTQVVAYDAHGGMYAARLWWLLRWVGHGAAAVLDGGLAAWSAAGQPLVTSVAERPRGKLADKAALVRTVSAAELLENLGVKRLQVVDARANDRFRGENETIDPVGGHIPGARNRFFKDNLQADGRFKDGAALKQELTPVVGAPVGAVMQCGSGVTACHNLLALEIAGLPGAALYPGSWSEWCADSTRPVATGPA